MSELVTPPGQAVDVPAPNPVLEARNLVKVFRVRGNGLRRKGTDVRAVDDVSLALVPGRVTALVGQSGSGKSTVARILASLLAPTSGQLLLDGVPVAATRGRAFVNYCGAVQLTLQDPFASLNPFHTVRYVLGRSLRIHAKGLSADEVERRSLELLERVRLRPAERYLERYPHELSGGERQRVSFARALAADPRVLLADEPVSMLDVTIRKEMLDLLDTLRRERELAILYITHDLASTYRYADETLVMYQGAVVERGPSRFVIDKPQNDYTQRLLAAAPDPERR